MLKLVQSNREEWQRIYSDICAKPQDCTIMIDLNSIDQVIEFRYVLPIYQRLLDQNIINQNHPLKLRFSSNNTNPVIQSNIHRLKRFFKLAESLPFLSITYSGSPPYRIDGVSGISPICTVSSNASPSYSTLLQRCYDSSTGKNQTQNNPLANIGNELLVWISDPTNYKWYREHPLSSQNKQTLSSAVIDYLNAHLPEMSLLSQIIWLYILRILIHEKKLFQGRSKQSNDVVLIHDILSKSRIDASNYAEGMYQAIENACLHSSAHQAWFGFRIHRAGRDVSINFLSKETQTRVALYKKYQPCFDSSGNYEATHIFASTNHIRYYFEFYVLDNAQQGEGISGTYNQQLFQSLFPFVENYYLSKQLLAPTNYHEALRDLDIWNTALKQCCTQKNIRPFISHIRELFSLQPAPREFLKEHIEDVVVHYGLRLLQQAVWANKGYLCGISPSPSGTQYYWNGNNTAGYGKSGATLFTEWNAILPISYRREHTPVIHKDGLLGPAYFSQSIPQPPSQLIYFSPSSIIHEVKGETKLDQLMAIKDSLIKCLPYLHQDNCVVLIKLDNQRKVRTELFAKAIFSFIANTTVASIQHPLRIALLFPDMVKIQEFIRFFSSFYFQGVQEDMEQVQIALCAQSIRYSDTYVVEFMLTGTCLSSALLNARLFSYYHPEDTLEHLPMLAYLTQPHSNDTQPEPQAQPLFPFDLFLPQELPSDQTGMQVLRLDAEINAGTSWFEQRISHILHSDIRTRDYGCMIDSTHIRLGSKLHVSRFFEAELLFHNTGHVARFAYLIAQNLLYGSGILPSNQNVLLLGYEKYSSPLLLQIKYWLTQSHRFPHIYTAIVYDGPQQGNVLFEPDFDVTTLEHNHKFGLQIVSVLPVGTTLSTIYKMHNTARKNLSKVFEFLVNPAHLEHNYCLVLVNSDLTRCSGDGNAITRHYWKSIDRARRMVTILRENNNTEELSVSYLIPAETDWLDPENCHICKKTGMDCSPMIDVKQTATIPGAIFPLYTDQHQTTSMWIGNSSERQKQNRKRISHLLGNVHYAHIYEGNNHFQFYLDHKSIYQENKLEVDEDLKSYQVDQNAFHVVISPLQIANSAFVKSVIDNTFQGCARFFHFDVTDTYREEIRSKFSFITQDYLLAKYENPSVRFCVHFVDNSIVTGSTLMRARLLIRMLLQQAGITDNEFALFDKVFLLINRCHPDTLNSFVSNPAENVYAYISLKIPSYNTENNICPACKVQSKYERLGKRSSTQGLSREFAHLRHKHKKRNYESYKAWQQQQFLYNHSYFAWLMQWLDLCVPDTLGAQSLLSFVPQDLNARYTCLSNLDHNEDNVLTLKSKDLQIAREVKQVLGRLSQNENCGRNFVFSEQTRLIDVIAQLPESEQVTFQHNSLKLLSEHILGVRDYMRLVSMQEAYEVLDATQITQATVHSHPCRSTILHLIADHMLSSYPKIPQFLPQVSSQMQQRFILAHNGEWLISFIKVLSREQLAKYYDYRQAISGVMSDILDILTPVHNPHRADALEQENTHWRPIIKALKGFQNHYPHPETERLAVLYYYQIYMTLVHRMADLQMSLDVADAAYTLIKLYHSLQERYASTDFVDHPSPTISYFEFPSANRFLLRYLKAVKSATMISNDTTPCLKLASVPNQLAQRCEQEPADVSNHLILCSRYLYLENTLMLYSGMRDLDQLISFDAANELDKFQPADRFEKHIQRLSDTVKRNLTRAYSNLDGEGKEEDILRQNMLNNFCRFWHRSTGEAPISTVTSTQLDCITYMLQYFKRLNSISDCNSKYWNLDQLPYQYEELCRCICGFTHSNMCYLVYSQPDSYPEIFAQSGYQASYLKAGKILRAEQIDELLSRARSVWSDEKLHPDNVGSEHELILDHMLIQNVAVLQKGNDDNFLVLGISKQLEENSPPPFYIVLQSDNDAHLSSNYDPCSISPALRKARDVLFMRHTLQEVLSRDYTVLINFRFDCSYIRLVCPSKTASPAALHLSDLHIMEDVTTLKANVSETLRYTLDTQCAGTKIDLLFVSGDIVDSRKASAPSMEQNYRYAEELLTEVAITLWCDSSGYLPHDWRRRVIITTGNHDYASMNQYQATLKHRELAAAMPIDGESGTMSKFAYFVDFLIRFLDPPIDELLRNDLNEIRYYRKLNLKVLALNCSGAATPRRTNKMGVNSKKLQQLLNRDLWDKQPPDTTPSACDPFRVCVAHYSPQYELSYFLDSYKVLPGWDWDKKDESPINQLVQTFSDCMVQELNWQITSSGTVTEEMPEPLKQMRIKLQTQLQDLNDALLILESPTPSANHPSDGVESFHKHLAPGKSSWKSTPEKPTPGQLIAAKIRNNELYQQISYYCRWCAASQPNGCDERISKLIHDISECALMSQNDKKEFNNAIKAAGNIDLYLAGHIHAYREHVAPADPNELIRYILVSDQFYDKNRTGIHGYIIQNMSHQAQQLSWLSLLDNPNKQKNSALS